jgi:NitT/TauT family transport system substrate-binding protein
MKISMGGRKSMKKAIRFTAIFLTMALFTLLFTACQKAEKTNVNDSTVAVTEEAKENGDNASDENKVKEVAANGNTTSDKVLEDGIIKILYGSSLCGIPLHIAKQLQFFEGEGLVEGVDYEYVTSSTPGVEMLSTKQADVSFGLVAAMLAPLDNGLEAKTVLGIHTGCIQIIAGAGSGIKSVADLKGKRIGVTQLASSDHIVTQRALASEGIGSTADNMEVEFIVYDKDNLPIALKEGAVDAIAIGDPKATILVNEGTGISIFNSATSELLKDEYCCALWARNETIEKQPNKLAKIVTAIQKASVWVDQNKELAAEIQLDNEWLVGDLEIDIATIEHFKYLPSVSGVKEALTRNIFDMKDLGLIRKDTDAEQLSRTSFARLEGVADELTDKVEPPVDPALHLK